MYFKKFFFNNNKKKKLNILVKLYIDYNNILGMLH